MPKNEIDLVDKLIDEYIVKNNVFLVTLNKTKKRKRLGVIWQWNVRSEKYVLIPVYDKQ